MKSLKSAHYMVWGLLKCPTVYRVKASCFSSKAPKPKTTLQQQQQQSLAAIYIKFPGYE